MLDFFQNHQMVERRHRFHGSGRDRIRIGRASSSSDDESTDINASWGDCYGDTSGNTLQDMIPCGNVNFGHRACCQVADMCLSSNACYNSEFGVTYLTGCTDSTYKDPSCPYKGSNANDSPWVGLSYCNGTSDQWVACSQAAAPQTVTVGDYCYCPQTHVAAFTDAATLTNTALLPHIPHGLISWGKGYTPTATSQVWETASVTSTQGTTSTGSTATSTTASSSSASTASSGSSTASSSTGSSASTLASSSSSMITPPPSSSPALASSTASSTNSGSSSTQTPAFGTGAIVGTSIGACALLFGLIALIVMLCLRRRRKQGLLTRRTSNEAENFKITPEQMRQENNFTTNGHDGTNANGTGSLGPLLGDQTRLEKSAAATTAPATRVSELPTEAAPPWSLRSELDSQQQQSQPQAQAQPSPLSNQDFGSPHQAQFATSGLDKGHTSAGGPGAYAAFSPNSPLMPLNTQAGGGVSPNSMGSGATGGRGGVDGGNGGDTQSFRERGGMGLGLTPATRPGQAQQRHNGFGANPSVAELPG